MMKFFSCLMVLLIVYSCSNYVQEDIDDEQNQPIYKKKDSLKIELNYSEFNNTELKNELKEKLGSYQPSAIDISKSISDSLSTLFIECINRSIDIETQLNILILKTYIYHMERSCRGYDIQLQTDENTQFIIDYYLMINNIEKESSPMVNSHIAYKSIKDGIFQSQSYSTYIHDIDSLIENCKISDK